jgi:hypothetical protein
MERPNLYMSTLINASCSDMRHISRLSSARFQTTDLMRSYVFAIGSEYCYEFAMRESRELCDDSLFTADQQFTGIINHRSQ